MIAADRIFRASKDRRFRGAPRAFVFDRRDVAELRTPTITRIDSGLKADTTLRGLEHMHTYEVVSE